ncbi:flagellar biosynthesis anti-sigma factor FlgM [Desulfovibrio psychrotolerans]|uniref:Negative regulator of flagellin synthesis n=1 Tax=Desulfovibrio psychrotolerans TaxID=415242 RepID=A0A7J0BVQ0_9BACT|nr:flagellar biosynthesis anti-sigma factor FlgM [Desulfovibrio psychrotolerans]GFM37790.1 flagellar biosynthesis anti-sigma factor FlgM [Desulfovibrio psychrotolerans]
MEIKNYLKGLDPYQAQLDKADAAKARKAKSGESGKSAAEGDRVSVSDEARLRTEAYRTALSTPDVRQEKVNAIKAKVDAGEYIVDSQKVAEKLIKEEVELFM